MNTKLKIAATLALKIRHFAPLAHRSFGVGGSPLRPLIPYSLYLLTLSLLPSLLFPAIHTVKQDGTGNYTLIQEAYLAASSNDTVLVWPGIYYENLHINDPNKDITIASLYLTTQDRSYIHNTIIDGNKNGSCIALRNTGQAEIIICGFTIQNGSGYGDSRVGGGLHIKDSNPKIIDNVVMDCFSRSGGGIFLYETQAFLSGNVIRSNQCNDTGGGICFSYYGSAIFDTVNKNSIYLNYAGFGSDISKSMYSQQQIIVVDTFTVLNPDTHFVLSYDDHGFPVDDLTLSIEYPKISPVNANLYVNPIIGNNNNTGLTSTEPLQTFAFALKKIYPDTLQPKSIFLSNGTYSPSTNGEILPISPRSNVSIIGQNQEETIVDAEFKTMLLYSHNLINNISIKNIKFTQGFGNQWNISFCGGMYFKYNGNIKVDKLTIQNTISSSLPGIAFDNVSKIYLSNSKMINNLGGWNLTLGNYDDPTNCFSVVGCTIHSNGPDNNPENGEGGGGGVSGNRNIPNSYTGTFLNVQITENIRVPDPGWGSGMAVGFLVTHKAKVDLVNATIGNNVVDGVQGCAVNVDDGAELNIYNSILYGDSLSELSLGYPSGSGFPATASIAYSNIEGGEQEIKNWHNLHTLNWMDGNMDKDPLWVGTADTAYYLHWDSPCINAGTPMYEEGLDFPYIKLEDEKIVLYKYDGDTIHLPATDLAGNPRISGGRIDMGAYEFQDTTTLVKEFAGNKEDDNRVLVYPNPFTAHTFISFRLFNPGKVVVKISDINGRHVRTLMDAKTSRGEFTMTWEGTDDYGNVVSTGTYIVNFYVNGIKLADKKIVKR